MFPECKCLEEGTDNCNQENGQCYCKIGYSGEICDKSKFHSQLGTYDNLFFKMTCLQRMWWQWGLWLQWQWLWMQV